MLAIEGARSPDLAERPQGSSRILRRGGRWSPRVSDPQLPTACGTRTAAVRAVRPDRLAPVAGGFDVLYLEGGPEYLVSEDPHQMGQYLGSFIELQNVAVSPARSADLIEAAMVRPGRGPVLRRSPVRRCCDEPPVARPPIDRARRSGADRECRARCRSRRHRPRRGFGHRQRCPDGRLCRIIDALRRRHGDGP
jgi:hypothetical protein